MQILIADDDPVYSELLEGLLAQWGHQVVTARDGLEAWNVLIGADSPNLILLDWMMPGMDGFELCRKLRQGQVKTNAYVLLMTGSKLKDDIIKVVVAGADDYLIKPFDPMDLKIRLRTAMRILDLQEEINTLRQAAPAPAGCEST